MNQVGLVGRLTKDPTLRQLNENRSTVSFVIAINRNFRNNQGESTQIIYFVSHGVSLRNGLQSIAGKDH